MLQLPSIRKENYQLQRTNKEGLNEKGNESAKAFVETIGLVADDKTPETVIGVKQEDALITFGDYEKEQIDLNDLKVIGDYKIIVNKEMLLVILVN